MPSQVKSRIAVGVMTGTSIDAVDACALHLHGHGLEMIAEPLGHASIPLGELAQPLRTLADDEPMRASRIARLRRMLGEACGEAIAAIGLEHAIDLIAVHGQTVHHAPPESWQMIDPFPLAHRFNARIVTDLRGLDRAAGGQGAPITPLSDWILYRHPHARAIVNLGEATPVPGGDWIFQHLQIQDGLHRIEGQEPFGIVVYAYDGFVSFAYPGGLDLAPQ